MKFIQLCFPPNTIGGRVELEKLSKYWVIAYLISSQDFHDREWSNLILIFPKKLSIIWLTNESSALPIDWSSPPRVTVFRQRSALKTDFRSEWVAILFILHRDAAIDRARTSKSDLGGHPLPQPTTIFDVPSLITERCIKLVRYCFCVVSTNHFSCIIFDWKLPLMKSRSLVSNYLWDICGSWVGQKSTSFITFPTRKREQPNPFLIIGEWIALLPRLWTYLERSYWICLLRSPPT